MATVVFNSSSSLARSIYFSHLFNNHIFQPQNKSYIIMTWKGKKNYNFSLCIGELWNFVWQQCSWVSSVTTSKPVAVYSILFLCMCLNCVLDFRDFTSSLLNDFIQGIPLEKSWLPVKKWGYYLFKMYFFSIFLSFKSQQAGWHTKGRSISSGKV